MIRFNLALFIILLSTFGIPKYIYADNHEQLQSIRQSILEQEKKLIEQKKQHTKLIADLKKQEVAIANLLNSIDKSEQALTNLNKDISLLMPQITQLEDKKHQQQTLLAKQLESVFKLGKTGNMGLIFSGEESERNERIITYYGYVNKERETLIQALKQVQQSLNEKKAAFEEKKAAQLQIQTQQKQEKDTLVKNQNSRKKTISELTKSMQLNQQKLEQLKENEAKLQAQIVKAEKENKKIAEDEAKKAEQIKQKQQNYSYKPTANELALMARVSGIGKPNHKLDWPVLGSLTHRFGESLQGELKWKGLVIKAKEGTKVKAVAGGRVILASWLQGYGFIVALDHGKGDMTLYGYNQRVMVNVGDNIKAGETIALVGSSGGQGSSALYFEIRRDGKALDPSAWLKKR